MKLYRSSIYDICSNIKSSVLLELELFWPELLPAKQDCIYILECFCGIKHIIDIRRIRDKMGCHEKRLRKPIAMVCNHGDLSKIPVVETDPVESPLPDQLPFAYNKNTDSLFGYIDGIGWKKITGE